MEKEQVNTNSECPACNCLIGSPLHSPHCSGNEIVEVTPPERRKRQLRCGHEEVDPSAFPLVSAAHEFKTPLVVMLGYTDLLLNGHLGAVNQKQKQVLGEIQEGAQRLQKLIQDLLLLQELKAGRGAAEGQESTSVDESVSVKLKFKPEVMENGMISLKLDPAEVSSIAGTLAVNGYPIIDTRDVHTSVELRDGESLVLAGLLQESRSRACRKSPCWVTSRSWAPCSAPRKTTSPKRSWSSSSPRRSCSPSLRGIETVLPTDYEPDPEEARELDWMPLGEREAK